MTEYLSMEQASHLTGLHPDYLGQLAREGKLKAEKRGHDWIMTKEALDEFLSQRDNHTA